MSQDQEAAWSHDWSGRSGISYPEYLQAREYERSIRFEIDAQTSRLIGSQEQLAERGFAIVQGGFEAVAEGIGELSGVIDRQTELLGAGMAQIECAIDRQTEDVVGALYWGFKDLQTTLGLTNETLAELVRLAKTPSQVWAFEQYEIARDEEHRGLFQEALTSINRAINGHGSFTGYQSEYRFHAILGKIRLGSIANCDPAIVDPAAAEQAFLAAARYALASDSMANAGQVLIAAGRAAFVQREVQRAADHTTKGLLHCPDDPHGHYQMARIQLELGNAASARDHLTKGLILRPALSIAAPSELEFRADHRVLIDAIIAAKQHWGERVMSRVRDHDRTIDAIEATPTFGVEADAIIKSRITSLRGRHQEIMSLVLRDQLLALEDASAALDEARVKLVESYKDIRDQIKSQLETRLRQTTERLGATTSDGSAVSGDIAEATSTLRRNRRTWLNVAYPIVGLGWAWTFMQFTLAMMTGATRRPDWPAIKTHFLHQAIWCLVIGLAIGGAFYVLVQLKPFFSREEKEAKLSRIKRQEVTASDAHRAARQALSEFESVRPPLLIAVTQ